MSGQVVRLVFYVLSIALSVAMTGRLFPVKSRLASALGLVMVAWAINWALLLALLVYGMATGDSLPSWREGAMTANAVITAGVMVVLHLIFPGQVSRGR